jgi:hypothetical protein
MFFPGLRSLTQRLPLNEGTEKLGNMTVKLARESEKVIERQIRQSSDKKLKLALQRKLEPIRAVRIQMEPYSRASRGLTYTRVCEMKAAGIAPPPASLSSRERSLIARAGWANMTASERSAIAKAREVKKAATKKKK